jgi:hypothetical protein
MRLDNIIHGGRRSYQRMDQTRVGTGSNVLAPWDTYTKAVSRKIDDRLITRMNRITRFEINQEANLQFLVTVTQD